MRFFTGVRGQPPRDAAVDSHRPDVAFRDEGDRLAMNRRKPVIARQSIGVCRFRRSADREAEQHAGDSESGGRTDN